MEYPTSHPHPPSHNGSMETTLYYYSPISAINQDVRRRNVAAAASFHSVVVGSTTSTSTGGNNMGIHNHSYNADPWDEMDTSWHNSMNVTTTTTIATSDATTWHPHELWNPSTTTNTSEYCTCRFITRQRRVSSTSITGWKPLAKSSSSFSDQKSPMLPSSKVCCSRCGKFIPPMNVSANNGFAWSRRHSRSNSLSYLNPEASSASSAYSAGIDPLTDVPHHTQALLLVTPQLRFISAASTDMQGTAISHKNMTHPNLWTQIIQATVDRTNGIVGGNNNNNNSNSTINLGSSDTMIGHDVLDEYQRTLIRDRANQLAAAELASLLWVLAHEMSLEDYGVVESQVFTAVFALVHATDKMRRMAGLAAIDALLAAPSADEERKVIKFANTLSNGLRSAHGDFEFLSAVCKALGHMVTRTANVDFVESEITRALEWLRTERSDRRLAACLSLIEFATHLPTTFHSKTSQATLGQGGSNEFIDFIFQAICDPQPIVRACAADALSQCLKILVERRHQSLTGLLCQVYFNLMDGLRQDTTDKKLPRHTVASAEAAQHGSLLVVGTMLATTRDFMLPRFEEVCRAVLQFTSNPLSLIRLEVVRLIPRLALRCPSVFGRRYLDDSLHFLMYSASTPPLPRVGIDLRPSSFTSLGQLILALTDETTGQVIGGSNLPILKIIDDPNGPGGGQLVELRKSGIIYSMLSDIFALVCRGMQYSQSSKGIESSTVKPALHCAASLVEALGDLALPYMPNLIDKMFEAGLSNDLIQCLQSISACVPAQQSIIEDRMLQGVSLCLAGRMYDPRTSLTPARLLDSLSSLHTNPQEPRYHQDYIYDPMSGGIHSFADEATESAGIAINMSTDHVVVKSLVLALETLSSFGGISGNVSTSEGMVPLLPFVKDVAACYLSHPSSEVRKAASLTCCTLLIPSGSAQYKVIGGYTGTMVECVLESLLQTAASDPSISVRLCVVQALDSRYDTYLCQSHHLRELFLLLQDEALAVKAAGLRLLGRLASINPGPILPVLRRLLNDLIVELQCGASTGRVREEATRLLVVYLRASPLQRLVHPLLHTLINALPLDKAAPPRLASASLEALGELAHASGYALKPWVDDVVPHVLEIMEDKSSASKQRTSLRTLGQIAGSTGYVIQPYLDYPKLLTQATEILPATKRAPWSLRREVIRTLGILGALDPDRYHEVASQTGKGGAVGGAYFENEVRSNTSNELTQKADKMLNISGATNTLHQSLSSSTSKAQKATSEPTVDRDADENEPAAHFMYEQYAMTAQPVTSLPPSKRTTPLQEGFYPAVAIQALMRIFRDSSLVVHHGMVVQAVMFIFKSLGVRSVPFLNKFVPDMIYAVKFSASSNLRESLLMQLAGLSAVVREHLRPYTAQIFEIISQFWGSRHMSTILELISSLAVGSPDEFRLFVPTLIQLLLSTFDAMHVADWTISPTTEASGSSKGQAESQKLRLVLNSIFNLKDVFGEYLRIIVPALLKLAHSFVSVMYMQDSQTEYPFFEDISVLVYRTVSSLVHTQGSGAFSPALYNSDSKIGSQHNSEIGLPACAVQPLVRTLLEKPPRSPAVGFAIVETLCVCAVEIGGLLWFHLYDAVVRDAIEKWQESFPPPSSNDIHPTSHRINGTIFSCLDLYDAMIKENLISDAFNVYSIGTSALNFGAREHDMTGNDFPGYFDTSTDGNEPLSPQTASLSTKLKVNQGKLQRAWDVSQRTSRDDWDEWMRRFAIQLLREAPSPSLRACSSLAHAYQPLSRELFSASFACCWKELSSSYRADLVEALKAAFVADISPEILQALLNLAEFMEFDPANVLPIEIPVLAELALKCRAYAKALHYAERQYHLERTSACVESLISINGKLDLPEAALGVLKVSSIGEIDNENDTSDDDRSLDVLKYNDHEMFYSVIWSTDDSNTRSRGLVDIAPREEFWLAKLGAWTEALVLYEEKLQNDSSNYEAVVGCMRCLSANGEWRKVLDLARENWSVISGDPDSPSKLNAHISKKSRRKAMRMCAQAAWRLGQWSELERYAVLVHGGEKALGSSAFPSSDPSTPTLDFDGAFYSAVLHVHRSEWVDAANSIDAARRAMDGRLTALMAESYKRSYSNMVAAQNLAELEEVVEFRMLEERVNASVLRHPTNRHSIAEARNNLLSVWRKRLAGCRIDAEVHGSIMAVRSLILGPTDEVESILTLSELSRQSQRYKFAERVLLDSLDRLDADLNGPIFGLPLASQLRPHNDFSNIHKDSLPSFIDNIVSGNLADITPTYGPHHEQKSRSLVDAAGGLERLTVQHRLYFAFVRHLWYTDRRKEALMRLSSLCDVVDMVSLCENVTDTSLRVRCWLELGEWKLSRAESRGNSNISEAIQADVLSSFKRATLLESCGYKAWHNWALLNFRIAMKISEGTEFNDNITKSKVRNHIIAAVQGFINAINQGTKKWCASVQQDLLNLLTCLFKFGSLNDVASVINDGITSVAIEAWLGVLPQLLARIHIQDPSCRAVLHPLLTRLGEKHPQALMYPLSVLLKSPVAERKSSAESLMNSLKKHSNELVEEALLVSSELIRVAILWIEMWYDGLEDASRLYYGAGNVTAMLELLIPLHEAIEKGATTKHERDFLNIVGPDLETVHRHLKHYISLVSDDGVSIPTEEMVARRHNDAAEAAMGHAWDLYYTVFRRVNKQLPLINYARHHLSNFSPALYKARSLELGVPGSYRVDGSYVNIEKFIPELEIMTSKQRPRKITLRGNDGNDYVFLLKGHEDIRQDERVMQLFGLVNALLVRDHQTRKHDLKIQRYAISPLSHDCGIVGWVPHTDTLHSLIRDYRSSKSIPLNLENRETMKIAPDYELLTVMQKVEVFIETLKRTTGKGSDLYEILWLKSANSEEWLDRRTRYTRSLAVMSMVGYILGLGDRHPSNLMLDKLSGRVFHIDFGDCFEVAMNREKIPERVPFRLTRMLIKAMEVAGIEGSYRSTCEKTMSVLRDSKDSLVAMLEAFVYDPLISWRLADVSNDHLSVHPLPPPNHGENNAADPADGGMVDIVRRSIVDPISEDSEEDDGDEGNESEIAMTSTFGRQPTSANHPLGVGATSRERSLEIYTEIQSLAAERKVDSRVASIAAESSARSIAVHQSLAHSRVERSMRQRELHSMLTGAAGAAREVALNEKALRVIQRVEDKLTGTDFFDCEGQPLPVPDQVQRLIVQATSTENLCQHYIGWCAFW